MPIVEAVMASANSLAPAQKLTAKMIETAMSEAVAECYKKGITDPAKVREAMMQARQHVKDEVAAAQVKRDD